MSRQFNQIFGDMKANLVYPGGEGNSETQMTEEQFDEWKANMWSSLCEHYEKSNPNKGQVSTKKVADKKDEFPLKLIFDGTESLAENYDMASRQHMGSKRMKVSSNKELRQKTDEGSTLEVIFDLKGSGQTYKTAQNLALFPENTKDDVEFVIQHLGVENPNQSFVL